MKRILIFTEWTRRNSTTIPYMMYSAAFDVIFPPNEPGWTTSPYNSWRLAFGLDVDPIPEPFVYRGFTSVMIANLVDL